MMSFLPLAPGTPGEPLVLLLAALALDLVLGLIPGLARRLPDAGAGFAAVAGWFDRRLNRAGRPARDLARRGALVLIAMLVLALAIAAALVIAARAFPYGAAITAVALFANVGGRGTLDDLRRGLAAAGGADLARARAEVGRLTGRDAARLDAFGLARAVVEGAAVSYLRRVVAPAFWFVALGLPGMMAALAAGALVAHARARGSETGAFAAAPAALDRWLGLVPSYLAGWSLALAAAATPRAAPSEGFRTMFQSAESRGAGAREPPNDRRVTGAMAGALGLALGGPLAAGGDAGWIGAGRARAGQGDIRRASWLCAVAMGLWIALVALATLARLF